VSSAFLVPPFLIACVERYITVPPRMNLQSSRKQYSAGRLACRLSR
jgi:hypothetical protein